jgi:hypothetical protein
LLLVRFGWMQRDHGLAISHVIDCTGRVTHTLTARLDGMVEVAFAHGPTAVADPRSRRCCTPGVTIPEGLWSEIASMVP